MYLVLKILEGVTDMAIGGTTVLYLQSKFVDAAVPVFNTEAFWGHRYTVPKRDYLKVQYNIQPLVHANSIFRPVQVLRVFGNDIWALLLATVFAMSATFALLHGVYAKNETLAHMAQPLPDQK